MISPLAAAKAYASVQSGGISPPTLGGGAASSGPDFASMVKGAMEDVVSTSKKAETQMTLQTQGKADMVDVVTAVASAQQSLSTMLAVRDQVISAYQQIMSMPV
jgi:flagellar hook-basal body complex protein FliE